MEKLLPIVFILVGIGFPVIFTIKNSKPKNVLIRIIDELKKQPRELWYHYFTRQGLEKWMDNIDFSIDYIQNLEIMDYNFKDYIWKYKVRFVLLSKEKYYYLELVKNPDIRAKSRWVINNIYEE